MITGWISALFPYLKDGRTGLASDRNPSLSLNSQSLADTDADLSDEIDDIELSDDDDDGDLDDVDLDDESDDDLDDDRDYVNAAWLYPMPGRRRHECDVDPGFNLDGPSLAALPSGLSKAPFRWEYLDRSFDMEFLAGFVGVSQDRETLAVKPEIGWAVRDGAATE